MEEIRLELEDKILNGLLTFDLASRQTSPVAVDRKAKSEDAEIGTDEGASGRVRKTYGSTSKVNSDEEADSGAESDLAPQVDELLKRLRAPPKATADRDAEMDGEDLSDDWPSVDGDNEEGVADSADEMEAHEEEVDTTKIDKDGQPFEPESPQKTGLDETTTEDAAELAEPGVAGKRYDLGKMAEAGHGGKIMFIFQKVSNGKGKVSK